MISVLFVYARENPDICYRQVNGKARFVQREKVTANFVRIIYSYTFQGMHEILALLLYVVHEDCQRLASSELLMKE